MKWGKRLWMKVTVFTLMLMWVGTLNAQWYHEKRIRDLRKSARTMVTLAQASVRLDVHPKDALVYVDGNLVGTVRDFNGRNERLYLFPGTHILELRDPNYAPFSTQLRVMPEQDMRIKVRMNKRG